MSERSGTGRRPIDRRPIDQCPGSNLLARPGESLRETLDRVLAATARALPIPPQHRRDLPYAVRDLSRLLTQERGELARSYWSSPRFLAAYLSYFLPWNLCRMAWLLPGLDLRLASGATILDLGSGPLTLPLALWCARPELRSLSLSFVCSDVAVKPMQIGLDILKDLAGEHFSWRVTLLRAPVEKALGRPGKSDAPEGVDCILAGNMLNELSLSRGISLEQRLEQLMALAAARLAPEGRLLLVEPGTRLGGKLVALSRSGALRQGLAPLAPCTHQGPCPMLAPAPSASGRSRAPQYTGWCHFFHPSGDLPAPLTRLAKEADLEKHSLSLSCLLLGKTPDRAEGAPGPLDELEALYQEMMEEDEAASSSPKRLSPSRHPRRDNRAAPEPQDLRLRVISDTIRLPGEAEPARYACCEKGLALLRNAARIPSGAFVSLPSPGEERRDAKSGALLVGT